MTDEQIVLFIRERDGAYYLDMKRESERLRESAWTQSRIYIQLDRLEEQNVLKFRLHPGGPERGHRDKRFYTLGDDANGYFARKWQDAWGTILKPQPF